MYSFILREIFLLELGIFLFLVVIVFFSVWNFIVY